MPKYTDKQLAANLYKIGRITASAARAGKAGDVSRRIQVATNTDKKVISTLQSQLRLKGKPPEVSQKDVMRTVRFGLGVKRLGPHGIERLIALLHWHART
jgi:hypothetical protein